MNLISVNNLKKSQNQELLFDNVSFGIESGQKIALIGVNGCGKSTLMRIIAGEDEPDGGTIARNRDCILTFLKQIPDYHSEDTISDHIFRSNSPQVRLIKRYESLCEEVAENPKVQKELDTVIEQMNQLGAWQYEYEIRSILGELGIHHFHRKMSELSGGMLKKVALAEALISDANFIIMDEPTNHLDVETVQWLEDYLVKTNKALLIVTHDRFFLDNVTDIIFEIDRKSLTIFQGNYGYYLEKKAEQDHALAVQEQRVNVILRDELKWLQRRPKARTGKQQARKDRIADLQSRPKEVTKEMEDLEIIGRRLGGKILSVENVGKSYGSNVIFSDFTYTFKHYERVGVVGPNGAGKSTLLGVITNTIAPDTGLVDIGENTVFGIFDQHSAEMKPDMRVIEFIKEIAEVITLKNGKTVTAGQMLERFLFSSDMQYRPIGKLSGGERRRLHLVSILMRNPNFLILDEPTNDLDIKTLSIFEDFLKDFPGCIVAVSHDRYFLNRVTDHLLIVDGSGTINEFPGDFSTYLDAKAIKDAEEKAAKEKEKEQQKPVQETPKQKRKLSYKEQQEYDRIEQDIEELEAEKEELQKVLNKGGTDYTLLATTGKRIEEIDELVLEKMERWEYLSSIVN